MAKKLHKRTLDILRNATLFHTLTIPEIKQLANGIEMKVYGIDDTIFEACDSLAQDFYIIKSGTVDIIDHNVTKTISKGEVFGDEVLTSPDLPCSRRTTAVAKSSRTEVLTITVIHLIDCLARWHPTLNVTQKCIVLMRKKLTQIK